MSRIEKFEAVAPSGVVMVVTRDIDTGEQTVVPKDGVAPAGDGASPEGEPKGNASRDEWAAWAEHLGIDVPEDAKRSDIKALVAEHGAAPAALDDDKGDPQDV